jgi:hypothetical protein
VVAIDSGTYVLTHDGGGAMSNVAVDRELETGESGADVVAGAGTGVDGERIAARVRAGAGVRTGGGVRAAAQLLPPRDNSRDQNKT